MASIKLHPGLINFSANPVARGNRVTGTASTLLDLITTAYALRYEQISGAPGWAGNDHYDIDAKAQGDGRISIDEFRQMMQSLLADRFQLKIRRLTKDTPAYALVTAKNGHKLKEAAGDAIGGNLTRRTTSGSLIMEITRGSMEALAQQVSRSAGRPVVDKTGLTGLYQYRLEWLPENRISDTESNIPSVFTALEEQLGLKLEATRVPFQFLVVDHAERPSEN